MTDNVDWVCLQKSMSTDDELLVKTNNHILNFGDSIGDFHMTGGLVKNLDSVISVDTSIAHLAGALSIPLQLLLPYAPDSRWKASGKKTPWYANATLHRQPRPGDWRSVFEKATDKISDELIRKYDPTVCNTKTAKTKV